MTVDDLNARIAELNTELATAREHLELRTEALNRVTTTRDELRAEVERLTGLLSTVAANLAADVALAEHRANALQQRLDNVQALAQQVDVLYPPKFKFSAEANYVAGYHAARADLRAALDGPAAPPQEPHPTPEARLDLLVTSREATARRAKPSAGIERPAGRVPIVSPLAQQQDEEAQA